jgi:leucine-zipper of insertion element IS481
MGMAQLVVTAVLVESRSKSEVARTYRVSRRWVIELVQRFLPEGDAGLVPRSRRPRKSPQRTAQAVEDEIIALRKELDRDGHEAGAATIAAHLQRRHGPDAVPAGPRSGGSCPPADSSPHNPTNARKAAGNDSPPNSRTNAGNSTSPTTDSPTARKWKSSTSSTTTPGYVWPAPPGECSPPATSTPCSPPPPANTATRPACCPTRGGVHRRPTPRRPGCPRADLPRPRNPVQPLPALPPADLRENRAYPPNREEMARPATPPGHPRPTPSPARPVPWLQQHHPTPPRPRAARAHPGLHRPPKSRAHRHPDRHRPLPGPATTASTSAASSPCDTTAGCTTSVWAAATPAPASWSWSATATSAS